MAKKEKKRNPKVRAALVRAFCQGSLGHQLSSPVLGNDPLLRAWLDWHGAEEFVDNEDRIIGVFACFCAECEPLVTNFVCGAGVDVLALAAGDRTFRRVNDEQAQSEERSISIKQIQLEDRIIQVCADLALQICERVAEEVATRIARQEARTVAQEVARTVAGGVAKTIAGGFARGVQRQLLVNQTGFEQAIILNHNSEGGS